ncbi:TPA: TIGR03759 family integrating conjugative element protein [Serratia fonticola]
MQTCEMKREVSPRRVVMLLTATLAVSLSTQTWAEGRTAPLSGTPQSQATVISQTDTLTRDRTAAGVAAWGVTESEWQRYEQLIQGRRGQQSPNLDPLMVLGIEAQSAEERKRFAELSVQMEYRRVEAELAFQREYDAAWKRLYPNLLPIQGMGSSVAQGGRLAVFVRSDCGERCDKAITGLLNRNVAFDVYLTGSGGSDAVVRQWAVSHRIPVEKVKAGDITLNHDGGRWLTMGNGAMPAVLKQGEGGVWIPAAY